MSNVGDLGRRVTERRHELGLSIEALAAMAGMDPTFLSTLETGPSLPLSQAGLWRLAGALDTTLDAVTGAGTQTPPGRADPSGRPVLFALGIEECKAHMRPGGVGRVVFSERRGPVAVPVNFRMLGDDVVFRTGPTASLVSALRTGNISFEVDHLDVALTEGWSVLVSGEGHVVTDPDERRRVQALGIKSWAGRERSVYICIVASELTGRRIRRADW